MRRPDYSDIPEVFRRAMEGEGWQVEERGEGGGEPPRRPFPTSRPWWSDRRVWIVALLLILFLSFDWLITTYTDWLWFIERGYEQVWLRQWLLQAIMFVVAFVIASITLVGSWQIARRTASRITVPLYQGPSIVDIPVIRWSITLLGLFFAFTFATAVRSQWELFLQYIYRTPFGVTDPIFGRDISFYVFELPVYNFVQGWFMPLIIFAALGVLGIYGLRYLPVLQSGRLGINDIPTPLRRTLAIMGGIFFALWALGDQLSIYELLYSTRGEVFGAGYTDLRATLWSLYVQIAALGVVSLTLFYNYFRLQWKPIIAALTLWIAAVILLSGVYSAVLQQFVVIPNEIETERPYIQYNIDMTRYAFGLDSVDVRPFGKVDTLTSQDLEDNEAALRNIRLWDYRPLQDTYEQLQELRTYYSFSSIDIDRYTINGERRQVMLAARELNKNQLPNNTWVNQKLEFTHGYGVVMNPVDRFTTQGRPEFFISNLPPEFKIDIEIERPEIYFGEIDNDVVFVGSARPEFSYPDEVGNVSTSYTGKGGVPVGGFLRKLIFAIRFGESNLLLSEDITPETRVIYYRQIQERIQRITPFFLLDRDPYLVISDGRLVWMQDAYTLSNDFPYSQPVNFRNIPINYIRNSVKITVDAYDGTVNYYLSDTEDPIVQTYHRAFPDLFKPLSELPEGLQNHIRYPEDLFIIQTNQYLKYHMTEVETFYKQDDLREIPEEVFDTNDQRIPMEPYYVMFRLPGEAETEYLLIQPYTPQDKPNMSAWIAARNDPEHYGQLVAYELPRQELAVGPAMVESFIDQEPDISQQFSLWNQLGSDLIRGNLIVIPLNDSFLYVEPIYLQSSNGGIPELKRVIVSSGERIVMRETLDAALEALLSNEAAAAVIEAEDIATAAEEEIDTAEATPTPAPLPTNAPPTILVDATIEELIQLANDQFVAAQTAQQNGDWAEYGLQIEALEQTLRQLEAVTAASE